MLTVDEKKPRHIFKREFLLFCMNCDGFLADKQIKINYIIALLQSASWQGMPDSIHNTLKFLS